MPGAKTTLIARLNGEIQPGQVKDTIARLRGGQKAKWLREHRQTIIELYEAKGADFVMREFRLKAETLDDLTRFNKKPFVENWTKADRASLKADCASADVKELQKRMDCMEARFEVLRASQGDLKDTVNLLFNAYSEFVSKVSERLKGEILKPLIESLIPPDIKALQLPQTNPLDVETIIRGARPGLGNAKRKN